ncbi:hypothetical protein CRUP_023262 [Coryphaenoides rupestris]|nr:hypothetical protein CRUP_023262 [Coryphaenoides rupestris]
MATFSQVIFNDIHKTYARSVSVTCHYTLAVGFQASTRDWVGIFKYYLPKEESEFYQFCYVDSGGHIKGASTPFNFQNPVENPDCSGLDTTDLLVVTTQDEMDQRARESEELREALEQLRTGSQRALEDKELEVDTLKEQNKARDKKERELMEELNQAREQNQRLTLSLKEKGQEADRLMEDILIQAKNHLQPDQHNASETQKPEMNSAAEQAEVQEKYEQAVDQIKCLQEELAQQRECNAQREESAKLTGKVKGEEEEKETEEMTRLKDTIQLLQVDLKCSERDKERLSVELKHSKIQSIEAEFELAALKRDNQELRDRFSQQDVCLQLAAQLPSSGQDYQLRLAETHEIIAEKEAGISEINGIVELRENRLKIQNQENEQLARDNKLHLAELHKSYKIIEEKDAKIAEINGIVELRENRLQIQNQENEQFFQDNQRLRTSAEKLHAKYCDLQAAVTPGFSPATHDVMSPAHGQRQSDLPESFQFEEKHNIMGRGTNTQERRMVCGMCHESFPGITQEELEQHKQSHRVCPLCPLLCDHMTQAQFEDHVYSHE